MKVIRVNMRVDGDPVKPYKSFWKDREKDSNPRPTKLIRLAQEIADMNNSLPCAPENSIFISVDTKRADYWKAIIFGAEGTPYAHGAFQYDIFFPDSYPNDPPKVNLMTTGGG
jgi:ubiquitin-protein ligase